MTPDILASMTGCGVCGAALEYAIDPVTLRCDLCGQEHATSISCPAGHYVCDACHSRDAVEAAHLLLARTRSADPQAILERLLAHSRLPMHGPEHHAIVAGVIVAAARNARVPQLPGPIVHETLRFCREEAGTPAEAACIYAARRCARLRAA